MSSTHLLIDIQTNGSEILEISWMFECGDLESYLVKPKDDLDQRTIKITGISEEEVKKNAISKKEMKKRLQKALSNTSYLICHYAAFEKRYLKNLLKEELPPIICTHKLSKHLLPGLTSYSLRSVSGYCGFQLHELKRARDHLSATSHIWDTIRKELDFDAENLFHKQHEKAVKTEKKSFKMDRDIRLNLPKRPGVYQFFGTRDYLLYIGKAKNLKSRVNSYFTSKPSAKNSELLSQIERIEPIFCETPLEAALLECELIMKHKPPYNKALKNADDHCIFLDKSLSSYRSRKSKTHFIGPFRTLDFLDMLTIFENNLAGFEESIFYGLEDDALFHTHFLNYADKNDLHSRREIILHGINLGKVDKIEFDDDWNKEKIFHKLDRLIAHLARVYLKARKVWRYSGISVSWKHKKGERYISYHKGRKVYCEWQKPPVSLPTAQKNGEWSFETYNRVRVFLTEFEQIQKQSITD